MARRVLADIDAEMLLRLGNRTDISATQRGFLIQDAYLLIAKGFSHKEIQEKVTEVVTQGADTLTPVTTDIWWPTQVKDITNGRILIPEDMEVIDGLASKFPGPPQRYYWWKGVFNFDTTMNRPTSITVWYYRRPPEITTGQSSILDQLYDPLIIMKAAQLGCDTVRDTEKSAEIDTLYRRYIQEHGLIPIYEEKKNDYRNNIRVRMR